MDHLRRYAEIGKRWNERFGVREIRPVASLRGWADASGKTICGPWPTTTRKRLYIWAHEVGHVALGHVRQRPTYVQEYEAELFAHALMREEGLAVPRAMTDRAKRYVQRKINRAFLAGVKYVDPRIAEWAGAKLVATYNFSDARRRPDYFKAARRRVAAALSKNPPQATTT